VRPGNLAGVRHLPVPDLWPEIERRLDDRATRPPARRPGRRKVGLVAGALAIGAVGVAIAAVSFLGHTRPNVEITPTPSNGPGFPGIGRILFERNGTIGWLYPDGSVQRIARGFLGAKLFPGFPGGSGALLAWKLTREDNDYYTMATDGSLIRHVLAPGSTVDNVPTGYEAVQVSPDGKKLAYLSYTSNQVAPGRARFELFVMDLATKRITDLGAVGPFTTCCHSVVWNDDSVVLLVQSRDARSIQYVNIHDPRPSKRGPYLRVEDPRFVSSYETAWPGAGPPTEIAPIGWDPDPYVGDFAVLLSQSGGRRAAVAVLTNRHTVAFAVKDGRPNQSLAWGLHGQFVLFSYSNPSSGGEYGPLYLGDASSRSLRLLTQVIRGNLQGNFQPLVEPLGAMVMFPQADGTWRFISLKPPYRETVVRIRGLPFDWGL
jgi:hypothetical protein